MFWMSFDQKLGENVEEHSLPVFMHAYVSGLHTQLVFMRMHTQSCICVLCSCVCVHVFQFIWTNARTIRMHAQTCVRIWHLKNPNFHYFDSFLFISLSNGNSQVLFLSFCKSRLPFQASVVLVMYFLGTGPWSMTQRPWCAQPVSSPSFIYFQRIMPMESQCNHWLRGGRILPTPSILLRGRWS